MHKKQSILRTAFLLSAIVSGCLWPFLTLQAQYSLRLHSPGTYLLHENNNELQLSAYTLECWLKLGDTSLAIQADTTGSRIIPVIARGFRENIPGAGLNYLLGIRLEDSVLYTVFEEGVPAGYPRRYFSLAGYTPLQKNTWTHTAVTFDGTCLALYLNGNLEGRIEADFKPFPASANGLSIGTALDIGGTEHGHCSAGIDRIRLWNYARSQAELRQWLDNEMTESQPGLIIGVNCDEGNGTLLHAQGLLTSLTLRGIDYEWQPGTLPSLLLPPDCALKPLFTIGLISDPQYCDCDPSGTRYYRESLRKLDAAVDAFNSRPVNFVVSLGDLIDRNTSSLDSVLLRYEKLEMPDYKMPGNHEFWIFPDSIKPAVIGKLGMPGYYYDFHYNNWHFLVLDAMELSAYTPILHPELSDEADSLWKKIQGQVNAYTYNGGIGRKQLEWIRQKLSESKMRSEPVILFSHHPVFPYNNDFNLWNDTAVVDLITQFPNVVAFINGHNHLGSYAFHEGIQFFTQRAMVETPTFNSFSVLSVYPDRIEVDGQGLNRDRTWLYRQTDTLSRFIRISNKTIHTRDTSGTFLGKVSLQSVDTIIEKASFQLNDAEGSNRFFALSGDSLFMNTNEDLSGVGKLKIRIRAMNCLKKMVSDSLDLVFDSLTLLLTGPLPDTVVDVHQKSISLPLDNVFTDLTRHGFVLSSQCRDPEKATVFTDEGQLICWPHQVGETEVTVTALDTFTGYRISDSLQLRIQRIFNKPPYATGSIDSLALQLKKDTLRFMPDTLFSDPDGDSLSFAAHAVTPEILAVVMSGGKMVLIPLQPGATDVALTASDNYGGSGQLSFHVSVWEEDPVGLRRIDRDETAWHYDPSVRALVIVSTEDRKSVQITLTDVSGKYSRLLWDRNLYAGNTCFTLAEGDFPPGVYVLNMMEGQQNLQCGKILITP